MQGHDFLNIDKNFRTIVSIVILSLTTSVSSLPSSNNAEAHSLTDPLSYIESGDEIQEGHSQNLITCSVTIISQKEAVTAGHCGQTGMRFGPKVGKLESWEKTYYSATSMRI